MKATLLPLALLLLFGACKKADPPPPVAFSHSTDRIKTIQTLSIDSLSANPRMGGTYRFTYTADGLVDTMQLFSLEGELIHTVAYERHTGYFLRWLYDHGPSPPPNNARCDSFVTTPDGRIAALYTSVFLPKDSKTTFTYDGNKRLTKWQATSNNTPLEEGYSVHWDNGNAMSVTGGSITHAPTAGIMGSYTYDAARPGQASHPLTLSALILWGQPLIQCNNAVATHAFAPGYPVLQKINWTGNRVSSYEVLSTNYEVIVFSFEYY